MLLYNPEDRQYYDIDELKNLMKTADFIGDEVAVMDLEALIIKLESNDD